VPSGQAAPDAEAHFDQVAQHASQEDLSHGISDALRSDQMLPLGQMVGDIYAKANPQQQAGMLNQLLGSLNPGALSSLGGVLGGLVGGAGGGHVQVSPQQVSEIIAFTGAGSRQPRRAAQSRRLRTLSRASSVHVARRVRARAACSIAVA